MRPSLQPLLCWSNHRTAAQRGDGLQHLGLTIDLHLGPRVVEEVAVALPDLEKGLA